MIDNWHQFIPICHIIRWACYIIHKLIASIAMHFSAIGWPCLLSGKQLIANANTYSLIWMSESHVIHSYNPFIYCWLNSTFRNGAKKFFTYLIRCEARPVVSISEERRRSSLQENETKLDNVVTTATNALSTCTNSRICSVLTPQDSPEANNCNDKALEDQELEELEDEHSVWSSGHWLVNEWSRLPTRRQYFQHLMSVYVM